MPEHLELPRPLLLLRTIAWSLTESAGLPVAAYAVAAWLGGRDAGLLAGLAATWATAAIRKVATQCVPSLMTISAVVLTLQTAVLLATGDLWIFLLQSRSEPLPVRLVRPDGAGSGPARCPAGR